VKAPEMSAATQKETAHGETSLPFLFSWLLGDDTEALQNRNMLQASETRGQEKAPDGVTE
jgi:hypothetical protein